MFTALAIVVAYVLGVVTSDWFKSEASTVDLSIDTKAKAIETEVKNKL